MLKITIKSLLVALSIGFIGLGSSAVLAESGHGDSDHGDSGHHSPHIVGLFVGTTDISGERNNHATFGLEYEYHFSKYVGVGVIAEHAPDAHHHDGVSIGLAAVHLHPYKGLRLTAAAGREYIGSGGDDSDIWRVGMAYEVQLTPNYSFAPTINADFIGGEKTYVYGVVLNRHF